MTRLGSESRRSGKRVSMRPELTAAATAVDGGCSGRHFLGHFPGLEREREREKGAGGGFEQFKQSGLV